MLFDHALPFCGSTSACTNMMLEAIQIKLIPNKKNILSDSQVKERTKLSHTLIIVGSYNQSVLILEFFILIHMYKTHEYILSIQILEGVSN